MLLGRGKTPQVPTLGWYASSSVVCEDGVHDPPMPEVVWPVEAVDRWGMQRSRYFAVSTVKSSRML